MSRGLVAVVLVACAAPEGGTVPTEPPGVLPPPSPPSELSTDTGALEPPDDDLPNLGGTGAWTIVEDLDTQTAFIVAVGLEERLSDLFELAACLASETPVCLPPPTAPLDMAIDFNPELFYVLEPPVTANLGSEVRFGSWVLDRVGVKEPIVYRAPIPFGSKTGEDVSLSWEGVWTDHTTKATAAVPPPLDVLTPIPGSAQTLASTDDLTIEWVPPANGLITLEAYSRFGFSRLYQLENDGSFVLDFDTLPLLGGPQDITVTLRSWTTQTLSELGLTLEVTAMSQASFEVRVQ
ncbi:MAG: hypothetical protein AAGA48_28800 [Myxococcota bacterium]